MMCYKIEKYFKFVVREKWIKLFDKIDKWVWVFNRKKRGGRERMPHVHNPTVDETTKNQPVLIGFIITQSIFGTYSYKQVESSWVGSSRAYMSLVREPKLNRVRYIQVWLI